MLRLLPLPGTTRLFNLLDRPIQAGFFSPGESAGMNGQEAGSATVTVAGAALTQTPVNWLQVFGLILAALGFVWNVYALITRNQHNKFMREQQTDSNESS